MNLVRKTFDYWANNGRAELMQNEHSKNVNKFLESISFEKPFLFLDVGCGNGWIVRKIARKKHCKKSIGIDISNKMILNAISKKENFKERFFHANVQSWKYKEKFDYIFSMESLYYSNPMEKPLQKIYKLLKSKGQFFCGTDFYKDNVATRTWPKQMRISLDYRSRKEWKNMFEEVGFKTKTRLVKDKTSRKKWKREFGTLFIIGEKSGK